jgi:hypothetical protein
VSFSAVTCHYSFSLRKCPHEYSLCFFALFTDGLHLYKNMLAGNFTCPDSIKECWISCDFLTDNYTEACRSLWMVFQWTICCILNCRRLFRVGLPRETLAIDRVEIRAHFSSPWNSRSFSKSKNTSYIDLVPSLECWGDKLQIANPLGHSAKFRVLEF